MILNAMADYYQKVVEGLQSFAQQTQWIEGERSQFEWDRTNLTRQFGPDGSWDESDAVHGVSIAWVHLATGARYLTGIATLLRNGEVLCLPPLIRSVFELAGRVTWLLDPRIALRNRAARIFLSRLEDATRAKSAAKSLSHPELVKFGHAVYELRRKFLPAHFYPSEIEDNDGTFTIRGEKTPKFKASLTFFDEVHQGNWNATGLYDFLSNSAHPTVHSALENFQLHTDPNGGAARWRLNLEDAVYPYRLSRSGVLAFIAMWRLMATYLDIDVQPINEIGSSIDEVPEPT